MKKLVILMLIALTAAWAAPSAAPKIHTATIVETMNAGGYTYMKVKENGSEYWVAVNAAEVRVGQHVTFEEQMWMPNFKSKTLNRTFDSIMFASMAASASMHPADVKPDNAPRSAMKKAPGGYSVAEVFAKRKTLEGKKVTVRGKVTKISKQIMKRSWIHIEDGTGGAMTDDLVFTTTENVTFKEGDTVVATGTAAVDKDFGYGYFYPVIIEKSSFGVER